MAKQSDTIFNFDMSRFLSDLRIPGLSGQSATQMPVPGLNVDAFASAQQRNLETLSACNKLALDGFQAIMRRQAELMRSAFEDASDVAGRMSSTTDMQQRMAFQTEVAKEAFERAAANVRELTELATNSNAEVMELLNRRVVEAFDEMGDAIRNQPVLGDAALRATVAESAAAASEAPKGKTNGSKAAPASKASAGASK